MGMVDPSLERESSAEFNIIQYPTLSNNCLLKYKLQVNTG